MCAALTRSRTFEPSNGWPMMHDETVPHWGFVRKLPAALFLALASGYGCGSQSPNGLFTVSGGSSVGATSAGGFQPGSGASSNAGSSASNGGASSGGSSPAGGAGAPPAAGSDSGGTGGAASAG